MVSHHDSGDSAAHHAPCMQVLIELQQEYLCSTGKLNVNMQHINNNPFISALFLECPNVPVAPFMHTIVGKYKNDIATQQ